MTTIVNKKPNLGKKLKIGECFRSSSKQMTKPHWLLLTSPELRIYRPGDMDFFTKGKRRYWCMVMAITETRTGVYCGSNDTQFAYKTPHPLEGRRYWQFTYMVKIIES